MKLTEKQKQLLSIILVLLLSVFIGVFIQRVSSLENKALDISEQKLEEINQSLCIDYANTHKMIYLPLKGEYRFNNKTVKEEILLESCRR